MTKMQTPHPQKTKTNTYITDTSRSLGQVIEWAIDIKQSCMEAMQEGQALLDDKHNGQTCSPLGLWQQCHCLLDRSPQPSLKAPRPRPHLLPTVALLPIFKLILQAHQQLVDEIRKKGMAENKDPSSGLRGDLTFSGIHLDNVNIFLT